MKTAHLPSGEPWYARWADHTWFDVRSDGGWWRVEVLGPWSGVRKQEISGADAFSDDRWGREAHVLADIGGADAARIAAEVLAKAEGYPFADGYEAWPGPNSNTFAVWLSREVQGLEFDPYPTAVGRSHRGWIGAGRNPAGDGLLNECVGSSRRDRRHWRQAISAAHRAKGDALLPLVNTISLETWTKLIELLNALTIPQVGGWVKQNAGWLAGPLFC